MATRIAINGFGRIGRYLTRLLSNQPSLELVAVNDIMPLDEAVHLLKYDSIHGHFPNVEMGDDDTFIIGKSVIRYSRKSHEEWDWRGVDIVVEATGIFTERMYAERHLEAGAKRVVIAAPADESDITIVIGVNDEALGSDHTIISNASCTTNCLALPIQHIEREFGVVHGNMTTVHPYTMRQRVLDGSHPDLRRARSCAVNIAPTPVGAHKTVELVIPSLRDKLFGSAIRVPVATVALIDLVCELKRPTSTEEIRAVLRQAANENMAYCTEPLVSSDFTGSTFGSVVDEEMTVVTDGTMLRLLAWYDNEASFTNQLFRLLQKLQRDFL